MFSGVPVMFDETDITTRLLDRGYDESAVYSCVYDYSNKLYNLRYGYSIIHPHHIEQ